MLTPISMKNKLRYLTLSFVLLLLLYPFLEGGVTQMIILNILNTLICCLGIYAVSYNKKNLIVAIMLGLPRFVASWMTLLSTSPPLYIGLISSVFLALFYGFTAIIILFFVLKSEQVQEDILFGAISIYMLIGGIFSMLYTVIETINPGSFYINPDCNINGVLDWTDFLYYSFATLTTLGYGDIVPVTSHARSFAIIEAIIGVMYLAIIISRLVGMYIAHSIKKE